LKEKTYSTGKEISRGSQQNTTTVHIMQGIRLWFLPGVAEVSLELVPQPGEVRFGMDIKPTDEVMSLHLKYQPATIGLLEWMLLDSWYSFFSFIC
jgi:hypothetical protein